MKVNLKGLFSNVAADTPRSRQAYHRGCLDEVYDHIQDVIDGKHTIAEFAEHYCFKSPVVEKSGTAAADTSVQTGAGDDPLNKFN